jgi:hypothetical protein
LRYRQTATYILSLCDSARILIRRRRAANTFAPFADVWADRTSGRQLARDLFLSLLYRCILKFLGIALLKSWMLPDPIVRFRRHLRRAAEELHQSRARRIIRALPEKLGGGFYYSHLLRNSDRDPLVQRHAVFFGQALSRLLNGHWQFQRIRSFAHFFTFFNKSEILKADLEHEDIREALRYAAEAVRERELPVAGGGKILLA